MANQHFLASIYRYGNADATNPWSTPTAPSPATKGISESFPSALTRFSPVRGTVVANGVTMNAVIKLLPSGLQRQGQVELFYTDATVATLNTAAT